jgi:hypothetical protein
VYITYRNGNDEPNRNSGSNCYGSLSVVGRSEQLWILEGAVDCGMLAAELGGVQWV